MRALFLFAATLALCLALAALPAGGAGEEARPVRVVNLPGVQRIEGKVVIDGPVRHGTLVTLADLLVQPVEPGETGRLVDGGLLSADGFTSVVLSLEARAGGRALRSGSIGAYLIPDEAEITRAFEQDAQVLFPLEISAPLTQGTFRLTAAAQARHTLGFPRYRVRLYNTTDKVVNATLYAYLTN
jgi:hypothetical protein